MSPREAVASFERAVRRLGEGQTASSISRGAATLLQPTWTDSRFSDSSWVARTASRNEKYPLRLYWSRIPERWQAFARLHLILAEYPPDLRTGGRPVRAPTRFLGIFSELVWLTQFMARNDLTAFCDFTPKSLKDAVREWMASPADGNGTASKTHLVNIQTTLQRLYNFGPARLRLFPDGLLLDPAEFLWPKALGLKLRKKVPTAEIPEDQARKTWQTALEWVESVGPALAATAPVYRELRAIRLKGGHSRARRRLERACAQEARNRVLLIGLARPVSFNLKLLLRKPKREASNDDWILDRTLECITQLWNLTLAAAYIVMAMLSGFRISEVLSVGSNSVLKEGDGWKARSVVTKTSSRERGYETDRPVPLGFVQAHDVLRRCTGAIGLPAGSSSFIGLDGCEPSGQRMNELVNRFAGLHGIEWHFASHQFRKFFALFYIRRYRGPTDALRWHFRHLSRQMIEAYIKDALNARYLAEAEAECGFRSIVNARIGAS